MFVWSGWCSQWLIVSVFGVVGAVSGSWCQCLEWLLESVAQGVSICFEWFVQSVALGVNVCLEWFVESLAHGVSVCFERLAESGSWSQCLF